MVDRKESDMNNDELSALAVHRSKLSDHTLSPEQHAESSRAIDELLGRGLRRMVTSLERQVNKLQDIVDQHNVAINEIIPAAIEAVARKEVGFLADDNSAANPAANPAASGLKNEAAPSVTSRFTAEDLAAELKKVTEEVTEAISEKGIPYDKGGEQPKYIAPPADPVQASIDLVNKRQEELDAIKADLDDEFAPPTKNEKLPPKVAPAPTTVGGGKVPPKVQKKIDAKKAAKERAAKKPPVNEGNTDATKPSGDNDLPDWA